MKHEKMPINIYSIITIILSAALLIGVIVWQFRGDHQPTPTDPSGSSCQPTGTQPSGNETNPSENSDPTGNVTDPTENGKPTEPKPTEPEPTEPKVGIKEANETVYATSTVNVRSGPGTSYEKLGQLAKGDKLTRTGICDNGWSRVVYNGKVAYVSSSYLTTTNPNSNTGGNTPGNTSGNTGGNTSNGNSDGNTSGYTVGSYVGPNVGRTESGEIIYTYTDGTTGTVPKNGATYVNFKGFVRVYSDALEQAQEKYPVDDEPTRCSDCGKVLGDGTNGTCLRYLMNGHDCPNCGKYVPAQTCHSCDED